MSTSPEIEIDLDLHFLPAWAQQAPATNRYANFAGESADRPARREGGPRGRSDFGQRPGGPGRGPGGPRQGQGQGRPGGPRREGGGGRGPDRGFDRGRGRPEPRQERPQVALPELDVAVLPEQKYVESIAHQIKVTGRAYALFGIAELFLKKPDRYQVTLNVIKKEGKAVQPLWLCNIDQTLWLSEAEAAEQVLKRNFATFYQMERIPTDPPKGTYTFVAQCGLSGIILGPPNYHDYQTKLHKLHTERFARMPFEVFKARVKIVRDEAVVKKWLDDQSFKTEYVPLNIPEAVRLTGMEAVEAHFREVHLPNLLTSVDSFAVSGANLRQLQGMGLQTVARYAVEDQRRFPIKLVTVLSNLFAKQGLQFFKVNKNITHVSVARPRYLDVEHVAVSESVKRILDFINATKGCDRRKIFGALAPSPVVVTPPTPAPAEATPAPAVTTPAAEGAAPAAPQPAKPVEPELTSEQRAINSDLHWLIHEGHVIEFFNGILETAKKPAPKPVRPAPAAAPGKSASAETAPAAPEVPAMDSVETTSMPDEVHPKEPAPESGPESESASVPQA